MEDYYKQKSEDVLKEQSVSVAGGLSKSEAKARLDKYGLNILNTSTKINPFKLFLSQFNDVLIIVLIIAATISLGLSIVEEHGSPTESLLIFAIVIAIAVVGFLNEYHAERTVEALMKLVGSTAKVRRQNEEFEIPVEEIVPGDIVIFEEGVKVPADIRLCKVNNLAVNEASLTGESIPVSKNTFAINETSSLGDQKNMLFSGTIVTTGTAEGVVVSTGSKTEIGKIAGMVSEVEAEMTPMQKKLDDLGRRIGAIVLGISIFVFVVIFFLDKDLQSEDTIQRLILAFTAAVALAVAAIPEGLAFVVRISLALGARRMANKNALIRKLSAVEALGSTDVICSDKTGTLTRGEMAVRQIYYDKATYLVSGSGYEFNGGFEKNNKKVDAKELVDFLKIGVLNNNAHIDKGVVLGDPTEGALIVSGGKAGLNQMNLSKKLKRVGEVPFSSDRKMMTTIHEKGSGYLVATKGSTDAVLAKCNRIYYGGKVVKLTAEHKKEVHETTNHMAKEALRVLAFAYKPLGSKPKNEKDSESKLIFAGLQGMMDPPRDEVRKVMHRVTSEAGMRVLMITGDHLLTAKAVAEEIGIEGAAITGIELDELTQEEFEERAEHISVYARVNPEHKIRIVKALKKHGHQVAMTGDGVNDAPAIKAADIGIAMGVTGTDAAKEASDLILLDDQFLTIVNAIEEGRGIFDNVRKFVNYLLSANIAEVITVLGGVVLFSKLVLSAAQLLFINIVTDGLPAVALGSDLAEEGIMRYKPKQFQRHIINRRIWIEMLIFGSMMSFILLVHFYWVDRTTGDFIRAVSVAFVGMIVYEMARLVDIRTDYKIRWFSNPWLSVAIFGSLVLTIGVMYVPTLANIFGLVPIQLVDWIVILVASIFMVTVMKFVNIALDKYLNESETSAPSPNKA